MNSKQRASVLLLFSLTVDLVVPRFEWNQNDIRKTRYLCSQLAVLWSFLIHHCVRSTFFSSGLFPSDPLASIYQHHLRLLILHRPTVVDGCWVFVFLGIGGKWLLTLFVGVEVHWCLPNCGSALEGMGGHSDNLIRADWPLPLGIWIVKCRITAIRKGMQILYQTFKFFLIAPFFYRITYYVMLRSINFSSLFDFYCV